MILWVGWKCLEDGVGWGWHVFTDEGEDIAGMPGAPEGV